VLVAATACSTIALSDTFCYCDDVLFCGIVALPHSSLILAGTLPINDSRYCVLQDKTHTCMNMLCGLLTYDITVRGHVDEAVKGSGKGSVVQYVACNFSRLHAAWSELRYVSGSHHSILFTRFSITNNFHFSDVQRSRRLLLNSDIPSLDTTKVQIVHRFNVAHCNTHSCNNYST